MPGHRHRFYKVKLIRITYVFVESADAFVLSDTELNDL
jgi:hypothetical protein